MPKRWEEPNKPGLAKGNNAGRNAVGLTPATSSLHMKKWQLSLWGKFYPHDSQEVLLSAWAWFNDGLAKLKPNDIHWAAVAVQPDHQLCRVDIVSAQYAEFKAVLIVLASTSPNESCYIFIVSGNVASDLVVWSATWKSTNWQIKNIPLGGHKLWKWLSCQGHSWRHIWWVPILWWEPTGIKLLVQLHQPDCRHCCLDSLLY